MIFFITYFHLKKTKQNFKKMDQFVLNASTCASATIITHPIELVKTRMQTQGELTRNYTRTYSGTAQSLILVVRSDGFRALWKAWDHLKLI